MSLPIWYLFIYLTGFLSKPKPTSLRNLFESVLTKRKYKIGKAEAAVQKAPSFSNRKHVSTLHQSGQTIVSEI
jgi:hypothetical protein